VSFSFYNIIIIDSGMGKVNERVMQKKDAQV